MRKLIRSALPLDAPMAAARTRRPAPPDSTSAEASYLRQAVQGRSVVILRLLGGGELRGRLIAYDRDCLKLQPEGEAPLLVRKAKVKYYWAERAPRPGRAGGHASAPDASRGTGASRGPDVPRGTPAS